MRKLIVIALISMVLGGCQGGGSTVREHDAADRYRNLAGAQLYLHQALWVQPERARVFIQGGEVGKAISDYRTQCSFEVDSIAHQGMSIEPGVFTITRVEALMTEVVQLARVQLASLDDGGGASAYFEGYHFWLDAPAQPQLRRMSCYGVFAEPGDLRPPTLAEIAETLGAVATLKY